MGYISCIRFIASNISSGDIIATNVGKINFMSTVTPLLAFAGISVGNQLDILKTLSWKLVVISFIVMTSTYFGSALYLKQF